VPSDHRQALRSKANQFCIPTHRSSACRRSTSILSARIIPCARRRNRIRPRPDLPSNGSTRVCATSSINPLPGTTTRIRVSRSQRPREPRGARGAAAAMLAHGVEESHAGRGAIYLASMPMRSKAWRRRRKAADRRTDGGRDPRQARATCTNGKEGMSWMWDNRATMHRGRPCRRTSRA